MGIARRIVPSLAFVLLAAACGGEKEGGGGGGGGDGGSAWAPPYRHVPPQVRQPAFEDIRTDPETGVEAVHGEVLVALAEGKTVADLETDLAKVPGGARVVGTVPDFRLAEVATQGDTAVAKKALAALPSVAAVSSVYLHYAAKEFDDPALSDQDPANDWGLREIGAPKAWDTTLGEGTTVAVIDSGVDAAHPDLAARMAATWSFATESDRQDSAYLEAMEHGTHVAGTVAATAGNREGTVGVAPGARIASIQLLHVPKGSPAGTRPTCTNAQIAAAISRAMGMGAQVMNLSIGPGLSGLKPALADPSRREATVAGLLKMRDESLAVFDRVLAEAAARGVVVVVAAGNDGLPANWCPLPSSRWTIGVGAVGRDGGWADFGDGFGSNYQEGAGGERAVDVCAPGKEIWSTYTAPDRYKFQQGTSMATPHVAGLAALLKAVAPSATFEEVRDVLVATAKPLSSSKEVGPRVDAAAAVAEMVRRRDAGRPPPTTRPPRPPSGPIYPPDWRWGRQPGSITIVIDFGNGWLAELIRFLLSLFLRTAEPDQGGRFDEFGRVVDFPRRVALGPPRDLGGRSRWRYVWDRRAELRSKNLGGLETYVVKEVDQAVKEAGEPGGEAPAGVVGKTTDATFAADTDRDAVVVATSRSSEPARRQMEVFRKVAGRLSGSAAFLEAPMEEAPSSLAAAGVSSVPTVLVYRKGRVLKAKAEGFQDEEKLHALIVEALRIGKGLLGIEMEEPTPAMR